MSFGTTMGFAARMLGIGAAAWVAGSLAWAGVEHDAATGMASWQIKSDLKQAYRTQPGILTCHTVMSLFAELSPQKTTIVNIPPPEDRGPGFDLASLDAAVDQQDCTLDTSQQALWMAAHQTHPPTPAYVAAAVHPASEIANPVAIRRTSGLTRGAAATARHGSEKS